YLKEKGINADKPVMLANVTAKLADKVWNEERMVEVLDAFIKNHPEVQIIFNFAPGQEEENALRIYDKLGKPQQVRVDIKAKSPRELVALCENITLFFGNEGGARHIAHAAGVPSLVVCAPGSNKEVWIPQNSVPAKGIAASDFASPSELSAMTRQQQYDLITAEYVKKELEDFFQAL
ncbi:MAG: lipopolysaccharide heptosyltransferase family protein, partial [Prevotella sp.]|nr:lipopolysaccharide heptosyltransferase family protein [Prevotella sp.]